jgi:hygromycin-B 4-O-kinase
MSSPSGDKPDVKPRLDEADVIALLRNCFPAPTEGLEVVTGGLVAQTYAFASGGEEYIVRFSHHMATNFEKEAHIGARFASPHIPIPPIVRLGRLGELHYAISRRMPGTRLNALLPAAYEALLPAILQTLDAIHAADVRDTSGFGIFGDTGVGLHPSWRAALAAIREEDPEWDFYGKWHVLFDTTFLERDVWEGLYARMAGLLERCPEDRYLVHGGYGFGNVLAADGRVTAVLDWLDAKYGDFLFDVAWLDFWSPDRDFRCLLAARYAERGVTVSDYDARILCYELSIALDSLRFFAKAGDEGGYRWARDRIGSLLRRADTG